MCRYPLVIKPNSDGGLITADDTDITSAEARLAMTGASTTTTPTPLTSTTPKVLSVPAAVLGTWVIHIRHYTELFQVGWYVL